jgi:hypothetical protein
MMDFDQLLQAVVVSIPAGHIRSDKSVENAY